MKHTPPPQKRRPTAEGGSLFEFPPPPPPPFGPPKVFEPVFLQIEILGKVGGTAGTKIFLVGMRHALELLNTPMCVYSKCSVRIGDFGSTAVLPSPWGVP